MAIGIRAFRSIGFPAKAAWVSAAFLLPTLILIVSLWTTASQNIEFSARERLGVDFARSLMPLLDAAQNRRRAALSRAGDLDQAQQRVAKAFEGAAATQQRLGNDLKTASAWQQVAELNGQLTSQVVSGDAAATMTSHTGFINAVLQLLNDVADNSNLTLDPDVDTYYLMFGSLFQQIKLIEQIGQMRGLGAAILKEGKITRVQNDQVNAALAFAMSHQKELEKALSRAIEADPALRAEIELAAANEASNAFIDKVRSQVMIETPAGDPAAFVAAGNTAITQHYQGLSRVLDSLDQRLALRVSKLRYTLMMQIGLSAVCVLVAIYMLVAFYRVTQGGIAEVARQLTEISKGNLTLRPSPWGRDEVAQLMNTLGTTLEDLRRIVGQVRAGADSIHTASQEVAAASLDLSQRTEEAASQLQRTSAAMTQIDSTVKHTASTATGASDIVSRNAAVAARGGNEVRRVVTTMDGIRSSSNKISDIVTTIDGIAFQTNILALNAAVEAARAGEQGRGFAVVASEVRALALRSAAAAREVKTLIGSSVEQVGAGAVVVDQAGQTMQQIVDGAERVRQLMTEISQGTSEQSQGLAEVGSSVERLDGMTQQNAALVEQTATAAASLKDNAERLRSEVAFFRTA